MSWNGSEQANSPARIQPALKPKAANPVRNRRVWWLYGGLLLLGCLAICIFINGSESEKHPADKKPNAKPKVSAAVPVTNAAPKSAAPVSNVQKNPSSALTTSKPKDLGFYTNKLGIVKRRTGTGVVLRDPPSKQLFTNPSDRIIDTVISLSPGDESYITIPLNFQDQFAKSLLEKIEINEDDTPDEIERKKRVMETREHLKERFKAGEDVGDILREEIRYLEDKARQYDFYVSELRNLRHSGASRDEVAQFAIAAKRAMERNEISRKLPLMPAERKLMKGFESELGETEK